MTTINTATMSDEEIVEIVTAFDRQGLPRNRRFDGDDEALRIFCKNHDINTSAVNFTVVLCVILREATIRGLTIPTVN